MGILEGLIDHQRELKTLYQKLEFLRDCFNFQNPTPFFEEFQEILHSLLEELKIHFRAFEDGVGQIQTTIPIILENRLLRDILIRMGERMERMAIEKNPNLFLQLEEFREILFAFFKKEKSLIPNQIAQITTQGEQELIKTTLKKLLK